jgi:hypothetical protein
MKPHSLFAFAFSLVACFCFVEAARAQAVPAPADPLHKSVGDSQKKIQDQPAASQSHVEQSGTFKLSPASLGELVDQVQRSAVDLKDSKGAAPDP